MGYKVGEVVSQLNIPDYEEQARELASQIDSGSCYDFGSPSEGYYYYFENPNFSYEEFDEVMTSLGYEELKDPTEVMYSNGTYVVSFYDDSKCGDPQEPLGNGFTVRLFELL